MRWIFRAAGGIARFIIPPCAIFYRCLRNVGPFGGITVRLTRNRAGELVRGFPRGGIVLDVGLDWLLPLRGKSLVRP